MIKTNHQMIAPLKEGNDQYKLMFSIFQADLPAVPSLGIAILTCMDARIDPIPIYGLSPGKILVLRNAGNHVTQDVIGSLLVAIHKQGIHTVIVLGHTDCQMMDSKIRPLLEKVHKFSSLSKDVLIQQVMRDKDSKNPFLAISDPEENVRNNVRRLRINPLFKGIVVAGQIYDVRAGEVRNVQDEISTTRILNEVSDPIKNSFLQIMATKSPSSSTHSIPSSLSDEEASVIHESPISMTSPTIRHIIRRIRYLESKQNRLKDKFEEISSSVTLQPVSDSQSTLSQNEQEKLKTELHRLTRRIRSIEERLLKAFSDKKENIKLQDNLLQELENRVSSLEEKKRKS